MKILSMFTWFLVQASLSLTAPNCTDYLVADIYYLLDASNSINSVGWGRELAAVVNITKSFPLGPRNVQVALGIFSTRFLHIFNLNTYTSHDTFSQAVLSTQQLKEYTYTYDALNAINNEGYLTSEVHGARPDAPKILIVITDGQSQNVTKTIAAADKIRQKNISTIGIGVGVTNQIELLGIAGNEKNLYNVKSFGGLEDIRAQITQRVCDAPNDPPPPKPCPGNIQVDIVFVVGSSSSIGAGNYQHNFEFIALCIAAFTIGESGTKVALLTLGTEPQLIFKLTSNKDAILQKLLEVPYQNSTTNGDKALLAALDIFSPENGGRANSNKTIVFVTDSKSSDAPRTLEAAEHVKSRGINIVTLGVTPNADESELTAVASKRDYSFPVANYSILTSFANNISDLACNAPPPPPPVNPCPPATMVDVFFLVDSSGSIGLEKYKFNFLFILRVLTGCYLAEDRTKVALLTYGTSVKPRFALSANRTFIHEQLQNVPYQQSTTNTHLALLYVITSGWITPEWGARAIARKVIVLITDGKSTNPSKTLQAADEVKAQNITIITLGVGDAVDDKELNYVASKPEYNFKVGDYNFLDDFASSISEIACNGAPS